MAKQSKKEVAKKEEAGLPAAYDYGKDAEGGFENQTREDYAIPLLALLQQMSPQCGTTAPLEGAAPGMMMNTATQALYEGIKGINFIPAVTQHVYVEWIPRDEGGGLVGIHDIEAQVVLDCKANQKFGEYLTPAGNDLIETFYVYGIMLDEHGEPHQLVIPMTSTKIKKYKQWMSQARDLRINLPDGGRITPPLFAHVFTITSQTEVNKKGQEYSNYSIVFAKDTAEASRLAPDHPLFLAARDFRDIVGKGDARADYAADPNQGTSEPSNEGSTPPSGKDDDDIPF